MSKIDTDCLRDLLTSAIVFFLAALGCYLCGWCELAMMFCIWGFANLVLARCATFDAKDSPMSEADTFCPRCDR